jgi:hypothetical protein
MTGETIRDRLEPPGEVVAVVWTGDTDKSPGQFL